MYRICDVVSVHIDMIYIYKYIIYIYYIQLILNILPPFWDSANNLTIPLCVDAVEVHCFSCLQKSAGPASILHRKLLKYGLRRKWTEKFQIDLNWTGTPYTTEKHPWWEEGACDLQGASTLQLFLTSHLDASQARKNSVRTSIKAVISYDNIACDSNFMWVEVKGPVTQHVGICKFNYKSSETVSRTHPNMTRRDVSTWISELSKATPPSWYP